MKATALCCGSLLWVQMLLIARDQYCCSAEGADGRFLHIDPNRLQFFEFDLITFSCVGFGDVTKWRVMRRHLGVETICRTNVETFHGPCHINGAYETVDSGEYWCDANGNTRSTSVKISVTAGSVILVSPSLPVIEGGNVTLSCVNKKNSPVVADFFKDGVLTRANHNGTMTIYNVSKSDEGLYRCRIVGAGESPESLLTVQVSAKSANPPISRQSSSYGVIVGTSVVLSLLLLVLGLYSCLKYKALITALWTSQISRFTPSRTETVSRVTREDQPVREMESCHTMNLIYNYDTGEAPDTEEEGFRTQDMYPYSLDEYHLYNQII